MAVLTIFFILLVGSKPCDSLQAIVNSFEINGVSDRLMPQQVIAKLTTVDNAKVDLNLRLVPHLDVTFPVEFISVDTMGRLVNRAEHITPRSDVSYYQDAQYKAAIQLTRYWDRTHELFGYNMKGHVIFNDSIYYIDTKTDNVSLSEPRYQFLTPLPNELPVQIISLEGQQINLVLEKPVKGFKCQEHFVANATRDSSRKRKRNSYRRSNQSRKSRNSKEYFIDILAVVDYSLYSYMKESMKESFPQKLYENFAFLFNEVDLLYKNLGLKFTLNIRLSKILILEDKESASFIESVTNGGKVDATEALESIQSYLRYDGEKYVEESDHVMVFTRFDLFTVVRGSRDYTVEAGANNGMMCRKDGTSCSVIEHHRNDFWLVIIVAHELGHSLASYHDGTYNNCPANARYIMAPNILPETQSTILNPFKFSRCSTQTFFYFISQISQIREDRDCLTKSIPASKDIPNVNNRLKGQEMTQDEQCEEFRGKGSIVCKESTLNMVVQASQVCTKLYCSLPSSTTSCKSYIPYPGTSCGHNKICRLGKCEQDFSGLKTADSPSTQTTMSKTIAPTVSRSSPKATFFASISCAGKMYNDLVSLLSCLCYFLLCQLNNM